MTRVHYVLTKEEIFGRKMSQDIDKDLSHDIVGVLLVSNSVGRGASMVRVAGSIPATSMKREAERI